jgi:hypothetical protein
MDKVPNKPYISVQNDLRSPNFLAIGSTLFRLRVFENRVLRRIFGPKRDEVTGGWRKLHNSIQFNSLLSMCHVNSHKANYRHSTV